MPEIAIVLILIAAILLSGAAYFIYFKNFIEGSIYPNRYSWLIWTFATMIETATYQFISDDWLKSVVFVFSTIFCVAICIIVWGRSSKAVPPTIDIVSAVITTFAIVLWIIFSDALWAHLLMVITIPIAFAPTWASAARNPFNEKSNAWMLWALSDLLTFIVIISRYTKKEELPFIIVEFLCHAITWVLVSKLRFWFDSRKIATSHDLKMGYTHLGLAVFAKSKFSVGDRIAQFTGDVFNEHELPEEYSGREDQYVQIGPKEYLGPSGKVDDFFNHSCDPNSGLSFGKDGIWLVAIRPINVGDEINWDYSTTIHKIPWTMRCACRAEICRTVIGQFHNIDEGRKRHYIDLGVVPEYVASDALSEQNAN